MLRYIGKRLLQMIPVIFGVITLVFFITALTPGDPAAQILGSSSTEEQREALREEMGLNDPVIVRYGRYLRDLILHFDMGNSYLRKAPVAGEIAGRFPTTFKLALFSMIIAVVIGVPLGIASALRRNTWVDISSMTFSLVGMSVPNFWLALLLILVFAVKLGLLPAIGLTGAKSWILPVAATCVSSLAQITRTTRSSMLETMSMDYIRTARAKGQKESVVIISHMLRNAIIPILTVISLMFGMTLGGQVLIESIFGIPGLGKYMIDAVLSNDYPCIQGSVLYLSVVFSLVGLLTDILYTVFDPRVRDQFKGKKKKRKAAASRASA
jgi:peptide/nickel transport system permease protein